MHRGYRKRIGAMGSSPKIEEGELGFLLRLEEEGVRGGGRKEWHVEAERRAAEKWAEEEEGDGGLERQHYGRRKASVGGEG